MPRIPDRWAQLVRNHVKRLNQRISAICHKIARIVIVKCQNGPILRLYEILCANMIIFCHLLIRPTSHATYAKRTSGEQGFKIVGGSPYVSSCLIRPCDMDTLARYLNVVYNMDIFYLVIEETLDLDGIKLGYY
jgi:hypothetical protein